MLGRPKLGRHRMVTVATRVEPDESQRLRQLANECGMSVCAYMRELVRRELGRALGTAGRFGASVYAERKPNCPDGSQDEQIRDW